MRIGLDVSQVVYETGVSNYTNNLIKSLVKIDKKNTYVIFGSSLRSHGKLKKLKEELVGSANVEFKLYRLPPSFLQILWNKIHVFPIEKFIGKVDVFHTSDWLEPPSTSAKKITTIHDLIVYLFETSSHQKIVKNQKRKLDFVKKESDYIIADSQTTKDDAIKFLEIPEEKIKVIQLAASEEFKPQDENTVRETLEKYKIKKPYVLTVSTLEPRKNIPKLVDSFLKISEDFPDISLVLAGKHGWGETLNDYKNVKVTGFIPQKDLICLYAGCRVFVYPSLYEGFGLPILEAMACGAPVITSNNSSMAEIAKDAAILIDPRSETQLEKSIKLVLSLDLENYQKMVNASLNRARKFYWSKVARETLKVYEMAAKSNN